MTDLDAIRTLVSRLDAAVPREDAKVRLETYGGGPEESRVVATPNGGLRLAIEIARAALEAELRLGDEGRSVAVLDLDGLLDPDSPIGLDHVELRESLELATVPDGILGRAAGVLLVACVFLVLALAVVGLVTAAGWLV